MATCCSVECKTRECRTGGEASRQGRWEVDVEVVWVGLGLGCRA